MTTMRRWYILVGAGLLLAVTCLLATPAKAQLAETLRANRWKKRIVLLYAPTPDNKLFLQQRALLAQHKNGQQERDMLILEAILPQLSTADRQYLRTKRGIVPGSFQVVLIGKDGGVKRRETEPVKAETLFSTIDTMPMRRQEMVR